MRPTRLLAPLTCLLVEAVLAFRLVLRLTRQSSRLTGHVTTLSVGLGPLTQTQADQAAALGLCLAFTLLIEATVEPSLVNKFTKLSAIALSSTSTLQLEVDALTQLGDVALQAQLHCGLQQQQECKA